MKCPNCGAELDTSNVFCDQCGCALNSGAKKVRRKAIVLPAVIFAVVFIVVVVGGVGIWIITDDYHSFSEVRKEYREAKNELEIMSINVIENENTDSKIDDIEGIDEQTEKQIQQEKSGENEVIVEDEQYILPESNTRYLTEGDIENLTLREINYAKNEIYARHGRKFVSQELQNYFNSKSWYRAEYEPSDFDKNYSSSMLNTYEKKNATFLSEKEFSINPSGYQLDVE